MKSYIIILERNKGALPRILPIGCTLTLIGLTEGDKLVYEYNGPISDAFGLIRGISDASASKAKPVLKQEFEPEPQVPAQPRVESVGAQVPPLPEFLAPGHYFGELK